MPGVSMVMRANGYSQGGRAESGNCRTNDVVAEPDAVNKSVAVVGDQRSPIVIAEILRVVVGNWLTDVYRSDVSPMQTECNSLACPPSGHTALTT